MPFKSKHSDVNIPDISLHEFLAEKIRLGNNKVALIDNYRNGKSITFKEIVEYSQSCAGFLRKQGLKKGDNVGVCAFMSVEFPAIILGILACGATVVFCNPTYTKNELLQQFDITQPKMIFVDEEAIQTIKQVQRELSCIKKIFVNAESQEFHTVDEMIKSKYSKDFPTDVKIDPTEDVALLPYSSGTTGLPKSVRLTHRNMVAILSINTAMNAEEKDTFYIDRPIYHASGIEEFLIALVGNIRQVYNREDDIEDMLKAIEKYKVTKYFTVPSFMVRFVESENITNKYDTSSLKRLLFGGAATSANVIKKMMKKLGKARAIQCYGATETSVLTLNTEYERYPASVGTLLPNVSAKIVDLKTGKELPINQSGEICVKGPRIMKGYLNNDEANSKAFTDDGWFRTGDVGYFDIDERLYIIDRIREVIKFKAVQVSPTELENVIFKLPQVIDVGVIGIPDVRDGEIPKAFIVRKNESLSADQIHAFVRVITIITKNSDELADYKQLRGGIEFVGSIPKSATGKIKRNELKKIAGIL